jgi:hypothetical protein
MSAPGDEGDYDVRGVAVEVLAAPVPSLPLGAVADRVTYA